MKLRFRGTHVGVIVWLFLLLSHGWAQRPCQVSASASPRIALVGETVLYTIQVQCSRAEEAPQVQPPDVLPDSGLTELVSRGTTQQTTIVNGKVSTTYEFRYTLTALKPGKHTLPPAAVAVDGEIYQTNEVTIEVQSTRPTSSESVPVELRPFVVPPKIPSHPQLEKALDGKIFILATVETTTPLSGQQFLLSYHLFIDQDGLAKAGIDSRRFSGGNIVVPQLKEFLKEELFGVPQNLRFEEQTIGGRRFAVAPLYQVALTPTRAGAMSIEPFQLGLVFPLTASRRSRSPLDDPFLGFFDLDPFDSRGIEIVVRSVPIEVNVAPLPQEGRPAHFCGAVGRFQLNAAVDKTHVKANEDIIRLRVTLSGEGNATVAVAPQFPEVEGVTLLEEPKVSTDRRIENNKLITSKTFDYLLRATREGKHRIPPLPLAVFNPTTRLYEELRTKEIEIVAAPGAFAPVLVAPQSSPTLTKTADSLGEKEIRKDLRYIEEIPDRWTTREALRRETVAAAALMTVSTAAFFLSWTWMRRRASLRSIDQEQMRRKTWNSLQVALRQLERADKDEVVQAATLFSEALRRYLATLVNREVELLTAEELSEALLEAGLTSSSARSLREILETCESLKYAPLASSPEMLAHVATRTHQLLAEVQECFRK